MVKRLTYYLRKHIPWFRSLPKPGTPFNGERFMQLLLWSLEGYTTKNENRFIGHEVMRNSEAMQLYLDVEQTFPGKKLPPILFKFNEPVSPRNVRIKFAAIVVILVILLGGGIYAIAKYWRVMHKDQQKVYKLYTKSLEEIADLLRKHYQVTVIFDNKELARQRFVGEFDTNKKLTDFLDDLTSTNGVSYYFDEGENLHFK